jgi:hypothetical protein
MPEEMLTEFQMLEHLVQRGVKRSPHTLRRDRCLGTGPRFRKIGSRVYYPLDEVDRWTDGRVGPLMSSVHAPAVRRRAETAQLA